ncbi:hypothetical protein [Scytonema sp. PRP1]|uniref:hypothetical protein n=1 Tax=Scytonema sp. PRP1 TaxID=3120513 RepID=UPI002FD02081
MYLVLIETSGNQNYIFSTNKLKENIGASELTYQAGTKWILEAVEQVSNSKLWTRWRNNDQLRKKLLNKQLNQPIESNSNVKVEIIVAASGKALLLSQDYETAKKIIRFVTHKALREAPGLDICGVISEAFNWDQENLGKVNRLVHQKFAFVRSQRPSPDLRFLRLPVVDECSTSGLPAARLEYDSKGEPVVRSQASYSKRNYSSDGFHRIAALLKREKSSTNFARSVRALDEELKNEDIPNELLEDNIEGLSKNEKIFQKLEWLSVIHADGNGLGEIFLNFDEHIQNHELNPSQANRNYVDKLRKFSIALDFCTERAFLSALEAFNPTKKGLLPIVPLVLGGDDLTVVCDGKSALEFTQLFLTNFERETASLSHKDGMIPEIDGIIPEIAGKALKVPRLSACAGVAIIKPHFPFSVAYELAEKLTISAKKVKENVIFAETGKPYPCSALDFHILYDSSDVEFNKIRSKLEVQSSQENNCQKNEQLHNRPYVVTAEAELQGAKDLEWAKFHKWTRLQEQVKVILADDKGRRLLPNSQMHQLRAGLFLGKDVADARYKLIRDRYRDVGIITLAGSENSLFQQEPESGVYTTGLLDALDAAEFLNTESETNEQEK